jgi:hypothetical protein
MRIGGVANGASAQSASRQVDSRRTPASMSDIRAALARAIESNTGRPARQSTVDVLAAQVSLETAHGSAMYNYNFGGIKGASPSGTTAQYLTHEVENGKQVTVDQGFRAYGSIDEGARDYVGVLQTRFPGAFARAASGDVDGFAHALKQSHYYTASEVDYSAGLRAAAGLPASASAYASAQSPTIAQADPSASSFSTTDELSRVLDAVAASATRIAEPDAKT